MVSYDEQILTESMTEFTELQTYRNVFAQHWEDVAELVLPTSRNTFYYGTYNFPGQKKTDRQVDSTAALALERFGAILDSLLTPRNMMWHSLEADNDYLMKDRNVRLYFEALTRLLFKQRYMPRANFSAQNQGIFQGLGAFGTGCMFTDAYSGNDGVRGLRYRSCPLGEMFLRENHQGMIDGYCRWFRLTAQQAVKKFKDNMDRLPPQIIAAAEKQSQQPFNFLQRVCPRDDYDSNRLDEKGKLWASYYISLDFRGLISEGGYNTFPVACSRWTQTPGEVYGRSPAMMVLPAIKTLNAEKRDFLTQGHRAAVPVLLTADDGIVDVSLRPGALNKGGMTDDGKPLVGTLPTGQIQVSKEMMDEERVIIEGAFLTDLFKVLMVDPKVFTAEQVTEMMGQRGILIAPSIGRQQSEYLGPHIERELDVLSEQRMLPPMPPALREAQGQYHVVYTSPLAREMRAQEVSGFTRTLNIAANVASVTQDPSVFDRFDFDTAIPDIASSQSTPERWMASDDKVLAKRKARADAAQRQQQIQAAPAAAAIIKAHAAATAKGAVPVNAGQ